MYDVPPVPAGFAAFQRSVSAPSLVPRVTVRSVGGAGGGARALAHRVCAALE